MQPLLYGLIQLVLTFPVLWAGRDFYSKGFSTFLHRNPNMDTLVAMGTAAAVGFSLWNMFGEKLDAGGFYFETAAVIIALICWVNLWKLRAGVVLLKPSVRC